MLAKTYKVISWLANQLENYMIFVYCTDKVDFNIVNPKIGCIKIQEHLLTIIYVTPASTPKCYYNLF